MDTDSNIKTKREKMIIPSLLKFISAFLIIGVLLFVPAGTLHYPNGWIYIAGMMTPMSFVLVFLLVNDPELLEKRLNVKEKETVQKKYVGLSLVLFLIAFIIPGIDFRFGWSHVPMWLVVLALILMLAGYGMFIGVILQNRYASRVIEIQKEQKLIDNGLYAIVRHPMYLAATVLYLSSPIILGSYYAVIPMLSLPFLLAYRILNEEKVLMAGLPGYREYTERVKFRLIPFIW
jgi:protein-S-isoprenylcysteine O-methyltransferase Ste14